MADLGADVVKVEEPGGDRARGRGPFPGGIADPDKSGLFLYLNTNKRGVTLDLREAAQSRRCILSSSTPTSHSQFSARRDGGARHRLRDAPRRESAPRRLLDHTVRSRRTLFRLRGGRDHARARRRLGVAQPRCLGASRSAAAEGVRASSELSCGTLGGDRFTRRAFRALESGRGEHIDLSVQAHVASFIEQNLVYYTYCDKVASRLGRRLLFPWGIFECSDGLIFLVIVEEDQWRRLIELMGNPEWASWRFSTPRPRADNADVMKPYISEWTRQWKVGDLFCAGQERRICFAPVFGVADLATEAQLAARGSSSTSITRAPDACASPAAVSTGGSMVEGAAPGAASRRAR